ncbi:MAG: carbohydrate ABC transporter permease [Dehalococcoidia bacterium]
MAQTRSPQDDPAEGAGAAPAPSGGTLDPGPSHAGPVPRDADVADRQAPTDVIGLGRVRAIGFVAPAMLLIGVFLLFPALWTLYIGATDFELTGPTARNPSFVWFDNILRALTDPTFYNALWLTLLFVLGSAVLGQNGLGFTLAWSLRNVAGWLRRTVESLVLLAWILPSSVVAFLWIAMLDRSDGTVNALLGTPGFAWLIDYPMLSIIVFNIWRGTAFSMLLYGAALASVPPSHLETARLAGASNLQVLRDVVFPHIRGHVLTNTLLITLWTFNDFTPFLITAGGPGRDSEIMPAYIYNTALVAGDMGYSGAISLLVLIANLALALLYLRMLRRRREAR